MSPAKELARLDLQKKLLCAQSTLLRARCQSAARTAIKPLIWIETARQVWQKAAPFVSLSSLFLPQAKSVQKLGLVGRAMRFAPVALRLWRHFKTPPAQGQGAPRPKASLAKESPSIAATK